MRTPDQPNTEGLTSLLDRSRRGDPAATGELLSTIYAELHALARGLLASERVGHTLQPTALVNEAYLRLVGVSRGDFENRAHFFGAAARTMRQILIDHARERNAIKRGGGRHRVTLCENDPATLGTEVDLLALNDALEKLERLDPRQCRVVELRFFAGFGVQDSAAVLGVSPRTVECDWQMARAWLFRELAP